MNLKGIFEEDIIRECNIGGNNTYAFKKIDEAQDGNILVVAYHLESMSDNAIKLGRIRGLFDSTVVKCVEGYNASFKKIDEAIDPEQGNIVVVYELKSPQPQKTWRFLEHQKL